MSDYIDPTTKPWGDETDDIWEWLKAQWEATVVLRPVPDTRENRIKEYRAITLFWRQKQKAAKNGNSLLQFMRTSYYDSLKVNPPNNCGCGVRFS